MVRREEGRKRREEAKGEEGKDGVEEAKKGRDKERLDATLYTCIEMPS